MRVFFLVLVFYVYIFQLPAWMHVYECVCVCVYVCVHASISCLCQLHGITRLVVYTLVFVCPISFNYSDKYNYLIYIFIYTYVPLFCILYTHFLSLSLALSIFLENTSHRQKCILSSRIVIIIK